MTKVKRLILCSNISEAKKLEDLLKLTMFENWTVFGVVLTEPCTVEVWLRNDKPEWKEASKDE